VINSKRPTGLEQSPVEAINSEGDQRRDRACEGALLLDQRVASASVAVTRASLKTNATLSA
jgi:hypothetical protein